ncbi:hypothetical protein BT69DRAFT_1348509 [Atractiella rhizophila]|nr:hypothetical protein BT69DRAFT_1348509 [Atractiella rhizophila]
MGQNHSTQGGNNGKHSSSPPRQATPPIDIDTIVDGGRILPVSHVYASTPQPEAYNRAIVQRLIVDRRLAPFFRGLEDYESSWGEEEIEDKLKEADQMARDRVKKAIKEAEEEMAQRQEAREQARRAAERAANEGAMRGAFGGLLSTGSSGGGGEISSLSNSFMSDGGDLPPSSQAAGGGGGSSTMLPSSHAGRRKEKELPLPPVLANPPHIYPFGPGEKEKKGEISSYLGEAVECPICFLNYSPLINRSRCCQQEICTECFIQIKRADPTITNPTSEAASCPYCGVPNFGIIYDPPRVLSSDTDSKMPQGSSRDGQRRRKSIAANSPEVVLVDHIHPNWEAKLAAVQATIARRANRRWVFRQVGDRLVPIGITSGRTSADGQEEGRRSRRRGNGEGQLVMSGQDLEELMVMEAMRLSLLEEAERERKEREAREREAQNGGQSQPSQQLQSSQRTDSSHSLEIPHASPSGSVSLGGGSGGGSGVATPRQMTPQHTGHSHHSGLSSLFHRHGRRESHTASSSIISSGLQAASIVSAPISLPNQIHMQGGRPRSSHSTDDSAPAPSIPQPLTSATPTIPSEPPVIPPIPTSGSLRPPLAHQSSHASSVGQQSMMTEATSTTEDGERNPWDGQEGEGYEALPETPAEELEEFNARNNSDVGGTGRAL